MAPQPNETKIPNLSKIIKRFSIIKNLIDLEETEDIPLQTVRLKQFETGEMLDGIIEHLESKHYSLAVSEIEEYIKQNQQVTIYTDTEISGLKLEAKSLETELKSLSDEKAEIDKLVFNFNVRHTQELGALIKEILAYKKEFAETEDEKQEAEEDEKQYNQEFETQKDIIINALSADEEKDLKKAYRKASKLCHPDAVTQKDKERASRFFVQLSDAYERNDIGKVNKILQQLKTDAAFTDCADALTKKEQLLIFVDSLRDKVSELLEELSSIKTSEEYQTIVAIEDWDDYFQTQQEQLTETLKQMQDGEH